MLKNLSKIVTFDYDHTISNRLEVQEYCKELIGRGLDVWIVTARYDDLQKHRYPTNPTNECLYKILDEIGLPKHKVRFMCMESKHTYLEHTYVLWHLDDDTIELENINMYCKTIGIDVTKPNWKDECEKLLKDRYESNNSNK